MKNKIRFVLFTMFLVLCGILVGCSKRTALTPTLSPEQLERLVNFGIFTSRADFDNANLSNDDKLVLGLIVEYNKDPASEEVKKQIQDAIPRMKNKDLRRKLIILLAEL
jgi:hypothetical protein